MSGWVSHNVTKILACILGTCNYWIFWHRKTGWFSYVSI